MRPQIQAGIAAAMDASHNTPGSLLGALGSADTALLVEHILAALAEVPADTPAPTVAEAPAGPALVISPADVVAMLARSAQSEITRDPANWGTQVIFEGRFTNVQRESREFVFGIQQMFGVRARTKHDPATGERTFLVAGTAAQIEALQSVYDRFTASALPVTEPLSAAQRREFWATLAALVTSTDEAQDLMTTNRDRYVEATAHLNTEYGPARNLDRTAPAESGEVYEQAAAVAANAR